MGARILITTDAVGGIWEYTRNLAASLSLAGNSLLVCVLGPPATAQQLLNLTSCGNNIDVEQNTGALEWMPDPWPDIDSAGKWLLRRAMAFRPDVVHLNSYSYATLSWPAPVVVVAHSCVATWWRSVHRCAPGPEWHEYVRRVKLGLQQADAIVAPSNALATDLKQFYGLDGQSIQVIHNSASVTATRAIRKQPFCLAAGRFWDKAKNLSLLEKVAGSTQWPIYIAGDNSEAKNLRNLGKLEHAEFLTYLEQASIFLHPALYEPFGLVALEAARFGCALLLSDIPSLRELWQNAASFLPPTNHEAWIEAINMLSANDSCRADLSAKAAERSTLYSQTKQADAYLHLYQALTRRAEQRAVAV